MKYTCGLCGDEEHKCDHHAIHWRPCYSGRKAGLHSFCGECCWRFVCITGDDLLEAQYNKSLDREKKMAV